MADITYTQAIPIELGLVTVGSFSSTIALSYTPTYPIEQEVSLLSDFTHTVGTSYELDEPYRLSTSLNELEASGAARFESDVLGLSLLLGEIISDSIDINTELITPMECSVYNIPHTSIDIVASVSLTRVASSKQPRTKITNMGKDTHFTTDKIDLVKEIRSLTKFGFQWYGLRQIDYTKKCACSNNRDEGITTTSGCSRCFRTGYKFTDFLVKGHIWTSVFGVEFTGPHSALSTQTKYLLLEWNRPVQKNSYILELDQDSKTGTLVQPYRIMRTYSIQDFESYKGDDARVEYWKCLIEERNFDDGTAGQEGTNNDYGGNRSNTI